MSSCGFAASACRHRRRTIIIAARRVQGDEMSLPLIFISIWLLLVIVGLIRPTIFLPLIKWKMKFWGRMTGFDVTPRSDQEICKKIRIFYSIFLVFGLFVLYLVLTGTAK
jgi:hypothetical protein